MSVDFKDDAWRAIIAHAIRLCNKDAWILEATPLRPTMWHKVHGSRTYCGGRITKTPTTKTATNVSPPPEEDQCIVCQFEGQRLFLIPGGKPTVPPPVSPPDPTDPGPGGPYTPNPPTSALLEGAVLKEAV